MKYSIVLLLILCITAHATPDMKKRLLKEKSRRAQHAQHNLGAPKLRADVCDTHTSSDNGATDFWGNACADYSSNPSAFCGIYDCTQSDIDGGYCTTLFDSNAMCCMCGGGTCNGAVDVCGVCGGSETDVAQCPDVCGVAGGDGSSCAGCDGVSNSGKVNDDCGVCDGSNACHDACGVANGDDSTCKDACGVPNGDDSSCTLSILTVTNAGCQAAKDYYNDQCSC